MAYTAPNTFTDGDIGINDEIAENIKRLTSYINQQISASDIANDSVDTQHIVPPLSSTIVLSQTEGKYFETGVVFGHRLRAMNKTITSAADNLPFFPNGFITKIYSPDNSDATGWRPVTNTGLTFYIAKASTVNIRYSGEFFSPDDNTGSGKELNKACISVDGTPETSSIFYWREIYAPNSGTPTYDYERRQYSSMTQVSLTEGWHHVCIVAGLNSNIAFTASLNCVLEAVHLSN